METIGQVNKHFQPQLMIAKCTIV